MEIRQRTNRNVLILDLQGSFTIGRSEERYRELVNQLLAEGKKELLINLAEVSMVDSSGLGALLKSFNSVKQVEGQLKLLKPSDLTRRLLSITGLVSIFEVFDDETAALSSF